MNSIGPSGKRPEPPPRVTRRVGRAAALGAALLTLAGCREAIEAHAPEPAAAHAAAGDVAESLRQRFASPVRDPRVDAARLRVARYALAPSRLADDSLWTRRRGSRRELIATGTLDDGRYRFRAAQAAGPLPARLGDARHYVALDPLPDGDWRWTTQVDHALGQVAPEAIGAVFRALLRSAERPPDRIRADYLTTAPRLTEALGALLTLDSVRTVPLADGSTRVTLDVRLHPDRIAAEYPDFARYVRRYVSPARYRLSLRDRAGPEAPPPDTWFEVDAGDDRLRLRFRSRDGVLQPLDGARRARPDSLTLHVDASVKVGPFTVGVRDLRARFAFVRTPDEVGWDTRFDHEPEWRLPPIAGRMVRAPLRRPFVGDGVTVRLTVRRLATGQTALHRFTETAVHESRIVRWLGTLGFTAMDDFAGRVELDEARFVSAAMRALRQDVAALR